MKFKNRKITVIGVSAVCTGAGMVGVNNILSLYSVNSLSSASLFGVVRLG